MTGRRLLVSTALAVGVVVAAVGVLSWQALSGANQPRIPRFVDEALSAGIDQVYAGDFDYYVGGGVAAFDCNDDGRTDLYLAGGSASAGLFVNDSAALGPLRFQRKADPQTDLSAVTGAYPLDVDGDGQVDLAVLRHGESVMLRGLGDCRFARANEEWGFLGGNDWTSAFSAKWDKGADWPTVAIGNYLGPTAANGTAECVDNKLFAAAASGRIFGAPIVLSPSWCTLSLLFTDWDRSGRRDLRVSNDRHYYGELSEGEEQLWRVEAGAAPRLYAASDGWKPLKIWGMGIGEYDVTGDGYPDYYLTSQGDNKLQVLATGPDQPTYTDVALGLHATATRPYTGDTTLPSTAWHTEFQDLNNDGLADLFVSKGNVEAMLDFAARDPSNLMIAQQDGTYIEAGTQAGIDSFNRARGAAIVDLNNDGLLDLVVVDRMSNVRVYRNVGSGTTDAPQAMGNWIAVRPVEDGANVDAVGAWIEVQTAGGTQTRELTVGGGHASGELVPIHFGLGQAEEAQVRITWPDGETGAWVTVRANSAVSIAKGAVDAVPLS